MDLPPPGLSSVNADWTTRNWEVTNADGFVFFFGPVGLKESDWPALNVTDLWVSSVVFIVFFCFFKVLLIIQRLPLALFRMDV